MEAELWLLLLARLGWWRHSFPESLCTQSSQVLGDQGQAK